MSMETSEQPPAVAGTTSPDTTMTTMTTKPSSLPNQPTASVTEKSNLPLAPRGRGTPGRAAVETSTTCKPIGTPTHPTISFAGRKMDKTCFESALSLIKRQSGFGNKDLIELMETAVAPSPSTDDGIALLPANLTALSSLSKSIRSDSASGTASARQTAQAPAPTPKGSHSSTKAAIHLCINPADNKSIVFNRTPSNDEFEDGEDAILKVLRRELCERITACDSIHSRPGSTSNDAVIYNKPPKFTQPPTNEPIDVDLEFENSPAPKKVLFSPDAKAGASKLTMPSVSF